MVAVCTTVSITAAHSVSLDCLLHALEGLEQVDAAVGTPVANVLQDVPDAPGQLKKYFLSRTRIVHSRVLISHARCDAWANCARQPVVRRERLRHVRDDLTPAPRADGDHGLGGQPVVVVGPAR